MLQYHPHREVWVWNTSHEIYLKLCKSINTVRFIRFFDPKSCVTCLFPYGHITKSWSSPCLFVFHCSCWCDAETGKRKSCKLFPVRSDDNSGHSVEWAWVRWGSVIVKERWLLLWRIEVVIKITTFNFQIRNNIFFLFLFKNQQSTECYCFLFNLIKFYYAIIWSIVLCSL